MREKREKGKNWRRKGGEVHEDVEKSWRLI